MVRRRLLPLLIVPVFVALSTGCGESQTRATEWGEATHGEASPVAPGARRIEVGARSFAFDPGELTVGAGQDIAVVLKSEDGLHDFTIDSLGAHVGAEAGTTGIGGFRADRPGRYTFYCSVAGHRDAGMRGTLVVTP